MGALDQKRQEFKKAGAHYLKALRHFEKAGDLSAQGELHFHLGGLWEAQGKPDKARESYEQAILLLQQVPEASALPRACQALDRMRPAPAGA
jgi:tetratricopeptide (TPR) repeat protein